MFEMNRNNIGIDPSLEVDSEWNPPCISAYIEMWFDVDEKFGTNTRYKDDTWINLYALYSPVYKTLRLEYYIDSDTRCTGPFAYEPTESEASVIMEMIEEKCREIEGCTCAELLLRE